MAHARSRPAGRRRTALGSPSSSWNVETTGIEPPSRLNTGAWPTPCSMALPAPRTYLLSNSVIGSLWRQIRDHLVIAGPRVAIGAGRRGASSNKPPVANASRVRVLIAMHCSWDSGWRVRVELCVWRGAGIQLSGEPDIARAFADTGHQARAERQAGNRLPGLVEVGPSLKLPSFAALTRPRPVD